MTRDLYSLNLLACDTEKVRQADSSIRMSSSFVCLYFAKSKLSASPAGRNNSPSRSERESVTINDTILSIRAQ